MGQIDYSKIKPEKNTIQPYLIMENRIEYKVYTDGNVCNDPDCRIVDNVCKTCKRMNAYGEAKLPTGKTLLMD